VITVGDLCFVALGQIVNRDFSATRYQPSGGLIVSSPSSSKPLRDIVTDDFRNFSEAKHLRLLIQDFLMPDNDDRRGGAYRRLAYYYSGRLEVLAAVVILTGFGACFWSVRHRFFNVLWLASFGLALLILGLLLMERAGIQPAAEVANHLLQRSVYVFGGSVFYYLIAALVLLFSSSRRRRAAKVGAG
jgi:hypothetical protein